MIAGWIKYWTGVKNGTDQVSFYFFFHKRSWLASVCSTLVSITKISFVGQAILGILSDHSASNLWWPPTLVIASPNLIPAMCNHSRFPWYPFPPLCISLITALSVSRAEVKEGAASSISPHCFRFPEVILLLGHFPIVSDALIAIFLQRMRFSNTIGVARDLWDLGYMQIWLFLCCCIKITNMNNKTLIYFLPQ